MVSDVGEDGGSMEVSDVWLGGVSTVVEGIESGVSVWVVGLEQLSAVPNKTSQDQL